MEENKKKRRLLPRLLGRTFGKLSGAKNLTIVELARAWYIRMKWLLLGVVLGYILYRFDLFVEIEKWFLNILNDAI